MLCAFHHPSELNPIATVSRGDSLPKVFSVPVISAPDTLGIGEDSVISAPGVLGKSEDFVISALDTLGTGQHSVTSAHGVPLGQAST